MSYSFLIAEAAWRARLEPLLTEPVTVYKEALTNNHYEGDITRKATLNIITLGELSYSSYTGGTITYQTPTETTTSFNIDQSPIVAFKIDDPQQVTTEIKLIDIYSERMAYWIKRAYDDYLAGLYTEITTNVVGANGSAAWSKAGLSGTGPLTVGFDSTANEILPSVALTCMRQAAVVNNAPFVNPNLVIPPWLDTMIRQELGLRVGELGDKAKMSGVAVGKSELLTGFAGWDGFYVSNLVANTNGSAYQVMGGDPDSSITFASAYEKTEALRLIDTVGTGVRTLAVFGATIPFEGNMALGIFNEGTYLTNPRSF